MYINKALTVNAVAFHNEQHQSSQRKILCIFGMFVDHTLPYV